MTKHFPFAIGAALALALSTPALTAPATSVQSQLPEGVYAGSLDANGAPAGVYVADHDHTAVVAKVSHIGYSLSVFRFDKVDATLDWNPAQPERSSLKATVETASIDTPVEGFARELTGDNYLKSAAFPQATFVSTAFRRVDATHGEVDGQFTLLGHTHPVTFDVELTGAGKGFMGHARIGAEVVARIHPADYGLSPVFGEAIILVIDAEFAERGAAKP